MGFILGFGIPIAYVLGGMFSARAVWRSRYKRDLAGRYDDAEILAFFVGMFWPVMLPFYAFSIGLKGQHENVWQRFFKANLPETNKEKALRLRQKDWDQRKRIRDLELECGLEPTEKHLGYRPGDSGSWY